MGCNAWNHPPGCNCGWGGDTGGGGWQGGSHGAASSVRHVPSADGLIWKSDRQPSHNSFVNPNAKCPVCGQAVFFYRSPFGGQVFFDELGPPWPKHPCTDSYFRPGRVVLVEPPHALHKSGASPSWTREGWKPLYGRKLTARDDCILLNGYTLVDPRLIANSGRYAIDTHNFCIRPPIELNVEGPVLCRAIDDDSGRYEVTFVPAAKSYLEFEPVKVVMFPSSRSGADLDRWESALAGDPDAQVLVGMALSFQLDTQTNRDLKKFPYGCDWPAALRWFRAAAEGGHWAALNNLGMAYLRGYGVIKDEALAFKYFKAAAQILESTPLRHLAKCYESGIGTPKDQSMTNSLRELADVCETTAGLGGSGGICI